MVKRLSFVAVIIIIFSIPLYLLYGKDFLIPYLTLLAIVVALFREKLLNFLFHPVLKISLADPPDHFEIVDARDPSTGTFVDKHLSISVFVENIGSAKADNVQLYFTGKESNVIDSFKRYSSIPMLRSWSGGAFQISSLSKNVPMRFSIGYIACNNADKFNFEFAIVPNALTNIDCKRKTEKTASFNFEVKAVSDNAAVATALIDIQYHECNWNNDIKISLS
jgi:hypothetical protein